MAEPRHRRRAQRAVAGQRPAGPVPLARAGVGEGDLMGEQLVVGEALAGFPVRRRVRRLHLAQRAPEAGPALPPHQVRVVPLRELRHALQRAAHRGADPACEQPGSQRPDRLDGGQQVPLRREQHVIRLVHLKLAVEAVELPGDEQPRAGGGVARRTLVEVDQVKPGAPIRAANAPGMAPAARLDLHHGDFGRDDLARLRVGEERTRPPVHIALGHVQQEVHDAHPARHALDARRPVRTDAVQAGDGGEEGQERIGVHRRLRGGLRADRGGGCLYMLRRRHAPKP